MSTKVEIPKKKPNYFNLYDKKDNKFIEIKYLSQQELAEGWEQKIPSESQQELEEVWTQKIQAYNGKRLLNHFSVTLAFLPEKFWFKLRKEYKGSDEVNFKIIKDGVTRYTIIETNQDDIMMQLFKEIKQASSNHILLEQYIEELDISQHSSWLVVRARHILKHGVPFFNHNVINFNDSKVCFKNM